MAKIELDKYYTPIHLAKYCIDKTFEIVGGKILPTLLNRVQEMGLLAITLSVSPMI